MLVIMSLLMLLLVTGGMSPTRTPAAADDDVWTRFHYLIQGQGAASGTSSLQGFFA
jgi:hypothetical protein